MEFVERKSTSVSVFPAHAGIQALLELAPRTNLDAGVRRHDELSLRLKHALRLLEGRGISTIPESAFTSTPPRRAKGEMRQASH